MPDRDEQWPGAVNMTLTFSVANAAATNSAVVAFGTARQDSQQMSPSSIRFTLVYDGARSEWQLRHDGFKVRHTAAATGTSLTAALRMDMKSGETRSVTFEDGGGPVVFGGMDSTNAVLRSLFTFTDPGLVRVISKNGAEAALTIEYKQDATLIIVR